MPKLCKFFRLFFYANVRPNLNFIIIIIQLCLIFSLMSLLFLFFMIEFSEITIKRVMYA